MLAAAPPTRESDISSKRRTLLIVLALLIWLFFLIRAAQVFTVGSIPVTMFNSDSAIVVMMSNEDRPTTSYNTYYYGQDRFGAWPFIFAQIIHRTTGYHWSNHALFLVLTIWLFISPLLLATLSRRFDPLSGLLFLLPLCLHVLARQNLFDLSQPYAWQVTALLSGWWCLRRFSEYLLSLSEGRQTRNRRIAWGLLAFWFSLLATLSSSVSGPLLAFLLALEIARSIQRTTESRPLKHYVKRVLLAAIPVAGAVLAELLLRANYHSYSLKHFGGENRTLLALDTGHLTENFVNQWSRLNNSWWWLIWLLPVLALAAVSVHRFSQLRGNKKEGWSELGKSFLTDQVILIIGTFGIGLISFFVTVLVSHVRTNDYSERFLTLSYLFLGFSGLLTLPLLAEMFQRRRRTLKYSIAAAALAILLIGLPKAEINPFYTDLEETAQGLSQRAPRAVLLANYWESYVFAGLDPHGSIVPIPAEGESMRTPWTIESLKHAELVIVEHHRSAFGGPDAPAPSLVQYGVTLRLLQPQWYVNRGYAFSVYRNENPEH